ncbi:hypothetical protein A9D14_00465 [Croceicoccus marinus]|uniref:DUF2793 domain-containing protein n=2 Tax=Croceicoccus marinus TaxID=450378 RepID=A0A1Z1F7Z7_9SPHN|nr:hypothetical protein A9D14_00465 [Croceicoccus marinus]
MPVAQAQKELFVNEALIRTDMLLQPIVEGEAGAPPLDPKPGDCWIVSGGSAEFERHENDLACWQQGQWLFLTPTSGMSVYDRNLDAMRRFKGVWSKPMQIDFPNSGSTVDSEARDAIEQIISLLRTSGHLPES